MTTRQPLATAVLAASVVIPSRDRPSLLLDTIDSILAARRLPREIIVVDQSTVPDGQVATHAGRAGCEVRYVHTPSPGVSRARNLGIRLAKNDIVVLLDDDMLIEEDAIERLLDGLVTDDPRTVATGRTVAGPGEGPGRAQTASALITRTEPGVFRGRQPFQVVPGTNIALRRGVLMEIGGYDERLGPGTRFPSGEDRDLGLRLLDAGCEVRHVPEAVVLHRSWRTKRDLLGVRWGYARGVGAFYAKHASIRDRHVLGLAIREVEVRLRATATTLLSSPATAAGHVVSLLGLLAGAFDWTARYGASAPARGRGRAVVLAYHAVSDLGDDGLMADYGVPADRMAAQLDALAQQGWDFVDLDVLLDALRNNRRLPVRAALVTFDDGYADLLTAGLPVLSARGIPAVVFAVSGHLGGSNDWDRELGVPSLPLLDADALRALVAHGVEVGSHTRSHPCLVEVAPTELRAEIEGSASDLAALGIPRPRAFAYPYGVWSPELAGAVARTGYQVAFTARPGIIGQGVDRLALPRVELTGRDNALRLRLKLATAGWPRGLRRRVWSLAGIEK